MRALSVWSPVCASKMASKIAIFAAIAQNESIRLECSSIVVNLSIVSGMKDRKAEQQPVVCWFWTSLQRIACLAAAGGFCIFLAYFNPWFSFGVRFATLPLSLLISADNNAQYRQIRCKSTAISDDDAEFPSTTTSDELKFSYDWL